MTSSPSAAERLASSVSLQKKGTWGNNNKPCIAPRRSLGLGWVRAQGWVEPRVGFECVKKGPKKSKKGGDFKQNIKEQWWRGGGGDLKAADNQYLYQKMEMIQKRGGISYFMFL